MKYVLCTIPNFTKLYICAMHILVSVKQHGGRRFERERARMASASSWRPIQAIVDYSSSEDEGSTYVAPTDEGSTYIAPKDEGSTYVAPKDDEKGKAKVTEEDDTEYESAPRDLVLYNAKQSENFSWILDFPQQLVRKAIVLCETHDPEELFDKITALQFESLEKEEACGVEASSSNSNITAVASERLANFQRMEFSTKAIQSAIQACGEEADDNIILDFILAHGDEESESINDRANEYDSDSDLDLERENIGSEQLLSHMGFTESQVDEALQSCGEEAPIQTLISFMTQHASSTFVQGAGDSNTAVLLQDAGYTPRRIERALEACGNEDISVLVDYLDAHDSDEFVAQEQEVLSRNPKKRGRPTTSPLPVPKRSDMTGYVSRCLTPLQSRLPYFYFENVSCMPKGEWQKISSFFNNIEPEFVDAKHFSVARRPRGYVHNLPLENRVHILPIPPKTIREFLPATIPYTPEWDDRVQLNCINTVYSASSYSKRIHEWMSNGEVSEARKKQIMWLCRKWNLVWTGPGFCAQLEPHEVERALGFDENHTRGAISMSERMQSLGNAFQVDTVGYHLSALKPLFPNGIRVLSLFSGIGGAEVALYRAGLHLKFVVSIEAKVNNRRILERWWKTTGQTGQHQIFQDVQDLSRSVLAGLMKEAGGFDLVIGGSPCNNLSGNNRRSRNGLAGEHSSLFYEFPRILNLIRDMMAQ